MQFKINDALERCLLKDRFHLHKQYQKISSLAGGDEKLAAFETLLHKIDASQTERRHRLDSVPKISYPDLPVSNKREDIKQAIEHNQVVIIAGETGSGKTTQIPKMCLELGRGVDGFIGHTQPRRLAARSVANRIAEELECELGESVGFKIRFSDNVSKTSHVKLMTDGILLAEIQQDRFLQQYDTIIIDEAHERSLNIDFLLGYFKQLLPKRKDLKLIITSATIDPERFSSHFDNAPIIQVSGRTYPVEIRYHEPNSASEGLNETSGDVADQSEAIVHAVDELMREKPGDILVFLSGERDIRDTQDILQKQHYRNTEIVPLYARLSASEQNRIFQAHSGRRIVLATNVAETSLTVPGIKYVIDPGLARMSRYSYRSKVQRLPIEAISQASANQRAGRCGRVSNGICIRLYSEQDFLSRPEFTDPEIVRTHLSSVILQMLSLGLGNVSEFPFVQPPDDKNINDGMKLLEEIQAITRQAGKIKLTQVGRKIARLPVDPRYAKMVIEAAQRDCAKEVMVITAGLSVQDPRERPQDKKQAADEKHQAFADADSDFISLLNLWKVFGEQQQNLSNSQVRKWCKQNYIHYLRMREWQDIVSQMKKSLVEVGYRLNSGDAKYENIHTSIASGLLSQVGMKDKNREYLGARNTRFYIFPGSGVFKASPKWLMAAELVETSKLYARQVAKIDVKCLEELSTHLVNKQFAEPHWSKNKGAVMAYMTVNLYGLPIVSRRLVNYSSIDTALCRELFIREALVNGDTRMQYAFLRKNQGLIAQVEDLEHKSRRRDLLADEDDLCEFYATKLPEDVCNEVSFKKWWRITVEKQPRLLDVDLDSLLKRDTSSINQRDFPDEWKQGNMRLPLTYVFEPNSPSDGVNVNIPLALLNQVNNIGFDWLVPGFQHELVVAIIKGLPKRLRRNFVPAPNFADACLAEIQPIDNNGAPQTIISAVADKLFKMTGVRLSEEDFNSSELPNHLQMTFSIVDENGKVQKSGKDLLALQNKLKAKVKETIEKVASPELERQDLTNWDFDALPRSFEQQHAGYQIKAYPALQKRQNKVDIVLLDNADEAEKQHRLGVYQLVRNTVPSPVKYLQQKLPNKAKLSLYFTPFGQVSVLIDDIILAAIDALVRAYENDNKRTIRTKDDFNAVCELVRANINDQALDIAFKIEKGMTTAHHIQKQCKGNIPVNLLSNIAAIKTQLNRLVYKGFVFDFGNTRLDDWNRYVQALSQRFEKLKVDPNRDRMNQIEVDKAQSRFDEVESKYKKLGEYPDDLHEIKWMIEEFKVSLFAQQLGTNRPISLKRIANNLSEL
ncbi:ATP-dependent RNA helicase HrpA [Glaciecola sp. MH2013]|uniref:ATP-dependent RNA helicase HrpA n=1 Tax=Glaciecola sp. MH2013 TaxID=2785524 RepID=UPI00189EA293|nr:ATP-dependent RNA helicase HrpA [Glaciecola sp. MH2013]MBF7072935.1 ATP-dependent RNA helicase HrpA [Glaciecola sp. MH2013]